MREKKAKIKPITLIIYLIALDLVIMYLDSTLISSFKWVFQYIFVLSILFIPGFLILNVFLLRENNNLDFTTNILLTLGISIVFTLIVLMISNIVLPIFNILPIKKDPVLISLFIAFLVLFLAIRKRNNTIFLPSIKINLPSTLLGLLIILMTLNGTLILKNDNRIIIFAFLLILSLPLLSCCNVIKKEGFPFLIWSISFSLVMYNSLFNNYIRPTDNIWEIFTIKEFVMKSGVWKPSIQSNILALPTVMLLVPSLSFFVGNLFNTYKFIIPFIASFIPVSVYKISEIKYGEYIAFYSAYFLSSLFVYFTWISITAKMSFAGLFLSLLAITMLAFNSKIVQNTFLIIFSIGLIFSHYGTSAIYVLCLMLSYPLLLFLQRRHNFKNFTILFTILFYGYSIYISRGSIFYSVTKILFTTINVILSFKNVLSYKSYGSELLLSPVPTYLQIVKLLYILSFIFGLLGMYTITREHKNDIIDEHFIISVTLLFFVPIPYIFPVGQYEGGRAWFIPSIFISPFIIKGIIVIARYLRTNDKIIVSSFLILFLAFNSGVTAEIFWHHNVGASIYISYPRIIKDGSLWEREYLDRVTLDEGDLISATWVSLAHYKNLTIYGGINDIQNFAIVGISRGDIPEVRGTKPWLYIISKSKTIKRPSYLHLTKFNVQNKYIKIGGRLVPKLISTKKILNSRNSLKIYTNGESEIYFLQ